MTAAHTIQTIFDIILTIAVIIALFNENKIVKFEKRLFQKIKKFLEVIR